MKSRHVISSAGANPYSPANHTGTTNQRVITRETVGAKHVEVLIGTIEKGHGALRHLHPTLEQASYLLQGEGLGETNGVEAVARPGHWMLTPAGAPHRFTVTSDIPVKVLVVYAPPYAENPKAAIPCEEASSHRLASTSSVPVRAAQASGHDFTPIHHRGAHFSYALDLPKGSAKHMAIYDARFEPGASVAEHALEGLEQVIFVRKGAFVGTVAGEAFEAKEGDWIFVPDGARHEYSVSCAEGARAFVIHAFQSIQKEQP